MLALGFKFSPFTIKTLVFAGGSGAAFMILPWLVPLFFKRFGGRPSELEAKTLLLAIFGLGRALGGLRAGAADLAFRERRGLIKTNAGRS